MDFLKVFDSYSIRARLFPAVIAAAPALAALALLISWKSFEPSNVIAAFAALVMLFAAADIARTKGRAIEPALYAKSGGKPSIIMFRRNDPSIDDGLKQRYREFLASKIGVQVPAPESEHLNQAAADSFYEQCGTWLRENTRDTKKFPLLFSENVTYGYRRNLLGVRWLALTLNLAVVGVCVALLWHESWNLTSETGKRIAVVLLIAVFHGTYILFAVRESAVLDASRAYARQLILSCETLLGMHDSPKADTRLRKRS